MTPSNEFQAFVYDELKMQTHKLNLLNEQITLLRIDHAQTKIRVSEGRKLHSMIFGMIGGIATAIIELFFRR